MSLFVLVVCCFIVICEGSLSDVTSSVFDKPIEGITAAFGDFDGDKDTDIFVISNDGLTVSLLLADVDDPFKIQTLLTLPGTNGTITGIVPGDFDGDVQMDVLVSYKTPDSTDWKVKTCIYWGLTDGSVGLDVHPLIFPDMIVDQPLVLDVNGDMLPDLLVEKAEGQRFYWLLSEHRNFTEQKVSSETMPSIRTPQSSAFVDFDNDLTADLCVLSTTNEVPSLEIWLNQDGKLTWVKNVSLPNDVSIIGQATFADIDGDTNTDILLPVCKDMDCVDSQIYVWSSNTWQLLPVGFSYDGLIWGFVPVVNNIMSTQAKVPITLRVGDYNLDGYPDVLAVLYNKSDGNTTQHAVILQNIECTGACGSFARTFSIQWMSSQESALAAFYDLDENGILDILITVYDPVASKYAVRVYKQTFTEDACFIKVTVVSGLCYKNCPGSRDPYGVNQPGPVSRYSTVDQNGNKQTAIATQLSQSAHFSLQLPSMVFGLGQTPNFVDTLEVGIPYPEGKSPRHSKWAATIPNSQLVVIPYPNDSPSSWVNKLFVTPGRTVMLTGASLLGTCGFIIGLVGILHWREKVEDKKEKLQEAHRFHFDAM